MTRDFFHSSTAITEATGKAFLKLRQISCDRPEVLSEGTGSCCQDAYMRLLPETEKFSRIIRKLERISFLRRVQGASAVCRESDALLSLDCHDECHALGGYTVVDLRQVPADADEAWERVTGEPEVRGVGADRIDFAGGWNVMVAAMDLVREDPPESELRHRIAVA